MDEASILRSIPPFDLLPRERFDEAARAAVERRFPAGARLAQAGGEPMQHLFVIREGSVRLERHGQTVQVLEEGETLRLHLPHHRHGHLRRRRRGGSRRVRAAGRRVSSPGGGPAVRGPLRGRTRGAAARQPRAVAGGGLPAGPLRRGGAARPWTAHLGGAGRDGGRGRARHARPPHLVGARPWRPSRHPHRPGSPEPCRRGGARRGRAGGPRGDAPAVDDARGDAGVRGVDGARRRRSCHHLPLVRDGEVVGVVTSTDLMRSSAQGPVAAIRAVERLASRDGLAGLRSPRGGDGVGTPRRPPRSGDDRRPGGPPERRLAPPDPPLGRGRPGSGARALGLARARVGGAQGADAPHRPGQRAGLRRRRAPARAPGSRPSPGG